MINKSIDLEQVEKKVSADRFLNGMMDITLGVVTFNVTLAESGWAIQDNFLLGSLVFFAPFIIAYYFINKYIIVPRIGYVKFSWRGRPRTMKSAIYSGLFLLTLMVIIGLMEKGKLPWLTIPHFDYTADIIGAVGIILIANIPNKLFGVKRFLYYGIGYALGILISAPFTKSGNYIVELWIFSIMGVIQVSIGVIIFKRFLKKYPRPVRE